MKALKTFDADTLHFEVMGIGGESHGSYSYRVCLIRGNEWTAPLGECVVWLHWHDGDLPEVEDRKGDLMGMDDQFLIHVVLADQWEPMDRIQFLA